MVRKNNLYAKIAHESKSRFKKTTIGGNKNRYKKSTLNKHKRKGRSKKQIRRSRKRSK